MDDINKTISEERKQFALKIVPTIPAAMVMHLIQWGIDMGATRHEIAKRAGVRESTMSTIITREHPHKNNCTCTIYNSILQAVKMIAKEVEAGTYVPSARHKFGEALTQHSSEDNVIISHSYNDKGQSVINVESK